MPSYKQIAVLSIFALAETISIGLLLKQQSLRKEAENKVEELVSAVIVCTNAIKPQYLKVEIGFDTVIVKCQQVEVYSQEGL